MSAEVVNLRRARKAKARMDRASEATENRVSYGRTRAERDIATAETDRAERLLDGHRRESATGDGDTP